MPRYDYRCHRCGEVFEVSQHFADAVLTVHAGCGGEVERLISLPALQFKGTGFYITDYGRNGQKPAANSNGKPESKSDSNGDSKSESKTENKSESKTEGKSEGKSEGKTEAKPGSKSESKSETKSESKPAPVPSSTK